MNSIIKYAATGFLVSKFIEYKYNPFNNLIGQDCEYNKFYNYSYVCNCFTYETHLNIYDKIKLNLLELLLDNKHILRVRIKSNKYYYDNSDCNTILERILFNNINNKINPELALLNIKKSHNECGIFVSENNIIIITNTTVFNGSLLHLFVNSLFNINNCNINKCYNNFNYIPIFSEVYLIKSLLNLIVPKTRNLSYCKFTDDYYTVKYIHNKIPILNLELYKKLYNLKFNSIICGIICFMIFESSDVNVLHIAINVGYNSVESKKNKKGHTRFNNSGIIPIIVNKNSLINIINEIDVKIKLSKNTASATYFFNTIWNYQWDDNGFDIIFNNVPVKLNNELLIENVIIKDYKVLVPHTRTPIFVSCFSDLEFIHYSLSIRSNDIYYEKCSKYDIKNICNILHVDI